MKFQWSYGPILGASIYVGGIVYTNTGSSYQYILASCKIYKETEILPFFYFSSLYLLCLEYY